MGWLTLIAGLVKFASLVMKMVERKGIIDGATAQAVIRSLNRTSNLIAKALDARRDVRDNPDSDYAQRLRRDNTLKSGDGGDKRE